MVGPVGQHRANRYPVPGAALTARQSVHDALGAAHVSGSVEVQHGEPVRLCHALPVEQAPCLSRRAGRRARECCACATYGWVCSTVASGRPACPRGPPLAPDAAAHVRHRRHRPYRPGPSCLPCRNPADVRRDPAPGPRRRGRPRGRPRRPGHASPQHHRPRGRAPADLQRGSVGGNRLQRGDLQLRGVAPRTGRARTYVRDPGGHARRGVSTKQYWDLPRERAETPRDADERVREWLDESVRAHLVSDVPVAAFLSGGLDSSAVVASWALASDAPHAFTARYFGSGAASANETDLARRLAARYGVKLTEVDIRPDVRVLLEPFSHALDEPPADSSPVPPWLLSQAVGASYKVALTGIGGDELFAGYRRHIGLLIGEHYARLPRVVQAGVSALANLLREPTDASLAIDRLKRFLRPGDASTPDRFLGYLPRCPDRTRRAVYVAGLHEGVNAGRASARFRELYQRHGAPAGLAAGLYLDYKTFLADDVLALSDRMAMAHSLEIRVPFVDHLLVERVFPLSDRVKIGWWRNKRLLKRALRGRLPDEHLRAPKRGFVGPTAA